MPVSFPLSFAPAPPPAGGSLAINLPFALGTGAARAVDTTRSQTAAVVRAVAAAVDLRSPETAARVARLAREEPDRVVPPDASRPGELDELKKLVEAVGAAVRDTSKSGNVTEAVKAHAAAAGADPRLVAIARDQLEAITAARAAGGAGAAAVSVDENAARWVASINVDVFANATRAGARSAGLALVPTPASEAVDLRAGLDALRGDFAKLSKDHETLKQANDKLRADFDVLVKRVDHLEAGGGGGRGKS